ncbi:MAG TPA: TIGR04282 family arsenosugar biosynthesis glycosyltransferase [Pyrinomonadaceae bacterium]|nr:TIGR04282 family arsenosugar biosynthesis glycosyltransferase [Pyrinomonadaceae bacterium]
MKRAIIIMAKAPIAGTVKTRLEPHLSAERCARLAECFLRDTINKAKSLKIQLILAYSPAAEIDYFRQIAGENTQLVEQKGDNLGEKMFSAFEFALARDTDAAVMIGTDSPTFPVDFIERAFELLETGSEAALGKTGDGGFYLLGLRRLDAGIFRRVEWSSAKTFTQVRENIMNLNWRLREVSGWYDIDEAKDLEQLENEFLDDENARKRAPETFEWITQNIDKRR